MAKLTMPGSRRARKASGNSKNIEASNTLSTPPSKVNTSTQRISVSIA